MYNYSKQNRASNRAAGSSKDISLLGPQFTVQAQATGVNERPAKQLTRDSSSATQSNTSLKASDLLNAPTMSRRNNSGVDGPIVHSAPVTRSVSHGSSTSNSYGKTTGINKRHPLPASTASAHDLASPEPLSRGQSSTSWTAESSGQEGDGRSQTTPAYLPGDRVIFSENPSNPGVPIVYRIPEEKSSNPDRLNLDRRRLTTCPILEGEEQLRLLNYQHNMIQQIQNLNNMKRLIFLDLYDNQIQEISGLNALKSLRVLMLGKNRIRRIEGLENLTKLDVLDLHGNQIKEVTRLDHLSELRVLNLAGNLIEYVDNLSGMDALTELNLRRNRIRAVSDVDSLPGIQRLFLSFNEIARFEDVSCLGDSHTLSEVSLDGNPFSQDPHYKQTVLRYMQQIRQFDMKRVSEDERRIATVMARKEEEKKRESNKIAMMKEKRRLAINNARRQWEVMQGSLMSRSHRLVHGRDGAMPDLVASHVATVRNSELAVDDEDSEFSRPSSHISNPQGRPWSGKSNQSERERPVSAGRPPSASRRIQLTSPVSLSRGTTPEKEKEGKTTSVASSGSSLNVNYLSELEGDTLSLYGPGALDAFDKNWGIQAAGAVTTISFKFIDFEEIAKVLHKIRVRFPNVHTLCFNTTNIVTFHQLNALSGVRRLDNITIDSEGNALTKFNLWKTYLLFRLAHFSLKRINDVEVSATDIVNAENFFGTLSHITTSQLPQSRLLALLGEKKKQLLNNEERNKKSGELVKLTDRSTESVGRAGLTYTPPDVFNQKLQDQQGRRKFVKSYVKELSQSAIQADQKHVQLQRAWPQIFRDMVHTAVLDMWDSQSYMKRCMEELEKS